MSASFALYKSSGQHFDRLPGHDDGGFSLSNANAAAVLDALRIEGSFSERPLADPLLPGAPHPTPWQSGTVAHEQGVSKAGNPRLRTTMIQLAWLWLRHQPHSALAQWFKERVKRNGGRLRKTTIVALARKLLVALWKYVNAGVVIEGAVMKVSS